MYHREVYRSQISSATSSGKVGALWPGEGQAFESTRLLSSKHRLGNRPDGYKMPSWNFDFFSPRTSRQLV